MVHLSRHNLTAFAGELSDWARKFAHWSSLALIDARTPSVGFISSFPTDRKPCLILPVVAPDRVQITALYGLRRSLRAATLADWTFDEDRWRASAALGSRFEMTAERNSRPGP